MSGLLDQLEEHLIVATQALEGAGAHIEKLERDNARLREAIADDLYPFLSEIQNKDLLPQTWRRVLAAQMNVARSALNPHEGEEG